MEYFNNIFAIQGVIKKSASLSEQWIMTKINGEQVYTKISVESVSFKKKTLSPKYSIYFKDIKKYLHGTTYEYKLYKYIDAIRKSDINILNGIIIPDYLGISNHRNMIKFITYETKKIDGKYINKTELVDNFNRNIFLSYNNSYKKISIGDNSVIKFENCQIDEWRYIIICLPLLRKGIDMILYDFFFIHNLIDFKSLIFQVAYTCHELSRYKIMHNDLHTGNIFVIKQNDDKSFIYNFRDMNLKVSGKYKALIYDFDRSYCNKLGVNRCLEINFCEYNYYLDSLDFVKFVWSIFSTLRNTHQKNNIKKLFMCIVKPQYIQNVYNDFINEHTNRTYNLFKKEYIQTKFYSMDNIIINLIDWMGDQIEIC